MPRLCQIIAIVKDRKSKIQAAVTSIYQNIQKAEPFNGLQGVYKPLDEENGEKLPAESKLVQLKVSDCIKDIRTHLTSLFDAVATQDNGNTIAKGTIKIDDRVIVADVPVPHLLFLEKQLTDIHTMVSKFPVLDPSENWKIDNNTGLYTTEPAQTHRTKKVPKAFVKAAATDKHPAQVDTFTEDIVVGYWHRTKYSGAISMKERQEMIEKINKMREAVKSAREEANSMEVPSKSVAKPIFDYIFG